MDTGESQTGSKPPAEFAAAATVAALTARVYALEQQLAALTQPRMVTPAAAPVPEQAMVIAPPPMPYGPRVPMPSFATTAPAAPVKPPGKTLEERFGSQLFNMIGILALFIAASLALKYAVDNGWVNPAARVVLGLLAGTAVVLWSERFRAKGLIVFSWSMKAIGSGVLYLTLWAAFHLFHLLPAPVALGLMVLVTAWNAYLAWSQDAELLAAYALVGGFITPLLLAGETPNELFLFSYILALALGTVLLVRYKPWYRLLPAALAGTIFYFAGWYGSSFHIGLPAGMDRAFWLTSGFAILFFLTFEVTGWRGFPTKLEAAHLELKPLDVEPESLIVSVILPLTNVVFLGSALYGIFTESGLTAARPWLAVALAAFYLGLMRLGRTSISRALHLASAVVLLTAAVPLKTHGHALTITWLLEGLALFWVANRLRAQADPEFAADNQLSVQLLEGLSALGFLLGLCALTVWLWFFPSLFGADDSIRFWNADLASALIATASLAAAVWLAVKARRHQLAIGGLCAVAYVGLLLIARETLGTQAGGVLHRAFFNGGFATELIGLAILAGCARAASLITPAAPADARRTDANTLSMAGVVIANLATIAIVVRELGALFTARTADTTLELKRSLAISAFLMVYGAVLLAIGFRRRSSFIRWQALILILFTILKVFLYDLSVLSAGYRILSIFGLGALLMGVSLAYQKDWFGLRAASPANPAASPVSPPATPPPAPSSEAP